MAAGDGPGARGLETSGPGANGPDRAALRSATLDVVGVLVFVLLGRGTHDPDDVLGGLLRTAWPFLAGLLIGWLVARVWRAPTLLWPTGVVVWAVTTTAGLGLRALGGDGLTGAFPLVTALSLAALLLGWRTVLALSRRAAAS